MTDKKKDIILMHRKVMLEVFGALFLVLFLTLFLNFFMNYKFIQAQIKESELNKINFERELILKDIEIKLNLEDIDLKSYFFKRKLPKGIKVEVYNTYGEVIGGTRRLGQTVITNLTNRMLNGKEETIYEKGEFLSFTNLKYKEDTVYLLFSRSDQSYKERIRNYYFRMVIIMAFVAAVILLLGFKLILLITVDFKNVCEIGSFEVDGSVDLDDTFSNKRPEEE